MKSLLLFGLFWQLSLCAQEYPEFLNQFRCPKSHLNYSGCMLHKFRSILPYYVNGVPELGVPPLDPYTGDYSIERTFGIGRFHADFKNLFVRGLRNTIFHSVKMDVAKRYSEVSFSMPWMDFDFDYNVKAEILSIPETVKGHFHGNFTGIDVLIKFGLQTFKKDGVEYFKMDKIIPKISIGDGKIDLKTSGEFQSLAVMLEQLFNDNPRDMLDVLNPQILYESMSLFREFGNAYFATLPVSEWVPE